MKKLIYFMCYELYKIPLQSGQNGPAIVTARWRPGNRPSQNPLCSGRFFFKFPLRLHFLCQIGIVLYLSLSTARNDPMTMLFYILGNWGYFCCYLCYFLCVVGCFYWIFFFHVSVNLGIYGSTVVNEKFWVVAATSQPDRANSWINVNCYLNIRYV